MRRYMRWYTCILLLCLCHHGICTVDASDTQIKQREKAFAEDKEHRSLIMRGQNSQPKDRAVNKDGMTAKQLAKMKQADRKRMQMLARRKRKESIERNKMRTNKGRLKPQYDGLPNTNPQPKMIPPPPPPPSNLDESQYGPPPMDGPPPPPPPPMMEAGEYGPPPLNADGPPPPPMRPPPPLWEGTGYGPPPPLDRPPPPPRHDMMGMRGSKSSKAHSNGRGNKPPIKPGPPPHGPFPPDNQFPPHFPPDRPGPIPDRPAFYPTYMPEGKGVEITIQGLLNTYGLNFPMSSEGYDAMVTVFDKTIYDSASLSLDDNQMVIQVRILEIEGITPQFSGGSRRELQNIDSNSFQCTIVKQQQCCERDPPQGSDNPAQFCESLGCNINDCRRIRVDIIAEQLSRQGRNRKLQSLSEVDELYTAITESITQQVNSGAFTIRLKENASRCGDSCATLFSGVTVMPNPVFAPPTDISVHTAKPTRRPTRKPAKEPIITYPTVFPTLFPTRNPTLSPTLYPTLKPTLSPTLYPTQSPTLSPSVLLPTLSPTLSPTISPTISPTNYPTISPTISPTQFPTISPTLSPTE